MAKPRVQHQVCTAAHLRNDLAPTGGRQQQRADERVGTRHAVQSRSNTTAATLPHSPCPAGDPQTGPTHGVDPGRVEVARDLLPCPRSTVLRDTAQHPATAARRERFACVAWRQPAPSVLAVRDVAPPRCLHHGCGRGLVAGPASASPASPPGLLPSPRRPARPRGPAAVAAGVTTRHTHAQSTHGTWVVYVG